MLRSNLRTLPVRETEGESELNMHMQRGIMTPPRMKLACELCHFYAVFFQRRDDREGEYWRETEGASQPKRPSGEDLANVRYMT